jgi:hypothetical protein
MFNQICPEMKIDEAMTALSDEHKEILVLICVKSMSYADVAQALGIPIGEVRMLLSRAREALQTILESPIPAEKKQRYIPPSWQGYIVNVQACHAA